MYNRNQRNYRQESPGEIQHKKFKERRCIMTKEKWLEIYQNNSIFAKQQMFYAKFLYESSSCYHFHPYLSLRKSHHQLLTIGGLS